MRATSFLPLLGLLFAANLLPALAAPINVVQVADMTGPNGDTGKDFVTGARVYFDQLNAKGGLNGRQINLVVEDDHGDPATTVALSRKLVSQYKPVALFGYFGADNVRAVLADKVLAEQPAALVAPYVGIDLRSSNQIYYLRANSSDEIAKISRIASSSGLSRVALVAGDDALGKAASAEIAARLADAKMTYVGQVTIPDNGGDIDRAAEQLAKLQPQAIILATPTINSAAFVQAYQRGRTGTAFYALSWVNPQTMQEVLGAEAVRWVAVSSLVPSPYNPTSPVARDFVATLKKYRDEPPSFASMEGYMAARMLVEGLRSASEAGPTALRRSLDDFRADLGGIVLRLSGDNKRASKYIDMAVFSTNGKLIN